ncbi:reverse transcriptase-like protein [Nesterenkonia aerolata]|uniref:Reverse transcriptase-like protein n=1 Tax=Nesterenkonia aerolata TaxID=3074079 RepID=A0ABU2DS60_9MICC|nr:reverse transcriptase-like protein [Nesterenkonia sp. LY-0111]MDR8019135.1 reverse transcriptase-like protein [Nesterenkonia sp. LY-0111]
MPELIIEADGGSRGNPGIAGSGALVRDSQGRILATRATPIGRASNNVAEYTGLIDGLRLARDIDDSAEIEVRMDSKLVVEQMSGRWKIKHEDMRRLAAEASAILPMMNLTFTWIPRAQNGDADALSNEAMDAAAAGRDWDPASSRIRPQPAP